MTLKELKSYSILSEKHVPELNSDAVVLRHNKTNARVFVLSNKDENKVFNIGFRTPPTDSTGLPHIMEHSVLCGSQKFPVKDPFVELVKGSLNTFLNAMTYPDMTVYPVASCNDKDFHNLMDVYLDAVFHPNIYKNEKIFRQEGWHYEAFDKESELAINGVVYNEMKGAFSSPEGVLDRYIQEVLYPDSCYTHESGGDPENIPDLTYQAFLDFHQKFYHPSNCFIYLYGDMDMAEKLDYIDREYLSAYDYREIDSEIKIQQPFAEMIEREIYYPITEEESEENATYLSYNVVAGDSLDPKKVMAFEVLEYVLLTSPGALIKKALIEAGIGEDFMGVVEGSVRQPYVSIVAKNAEKAQKDEFLRIIRETMQKVVKEGFNRKSLRAAINYEEFRAREADYGSTPTGLMYALQCMDSWLYDADPLMHLEYEETFAFLKDNVETGYFEGLVEEYLLNNNHAAVIIVSPKKNYTQIQDEKLRQKLAAYKETLTEEEVEKIVEDTIALQEYQDSEDNKEDLEKIPLLSRSDINRQAEDLSFEVKEIDGSQVLCHEAFTSGISYVKLMFSTEAIRNELIPYVGLMKSVLGMVDTEKRSYGDLADDVNLHTGGITFNSVTHMKEANPDEFYRQFTCGLRVLNNKVDDGFDLLREILMESKLEDEGRLKEIVAEVRSRLQMRFSSAGHGSAISRAFSYFSKSSVYMEKMDGIDFYYFIEDLWKNFDEKKSEIIANIKEFVQTLFTADNVMVSFTGDKDGYEKLSAALKSFKAALPQGSGERYTFECGFEKKNEGFMTASQVNYVAHCGTFRKAGYAYTGALRTLKVILGYDYLWLNVRVKGGAYGVMNGFGRSGEGYFVSYRDPNVRETEDIYQNVPKYIEEFDCDDRDMTKYVIGTISDMDFPMLPHHKAVRAESFWFSGITQEMIQKEREEILDVTQADIRALAGHIRAILDTDCICALGNTDKIKASADVFKEVKNLLV